MKEQGYTVKRGKHIAFKAPDQERFTRAKRLGAEYTEDEIKSCIAKSKPPQSQKAQAEKSLPSEPKPQVPKPKKPTQPSTQQAKRRTPQAQEPIPLMPLTPPPKSQPQKPPQQKPQPPQPPPPLKGIALWESIINRTDTAEIYNLMQDHGGYQHFVDLMANSRKDYETIDNSIKANEERIIALRYWRNDIADLKRTRKVYE
jgi:hypothetical protein